MPTTDPFSTQLPEWSFINTIMTNLFPCLKLLNGPIIHRTKFKFFSISYKILTSAWFSGFFSHQFLNPELGSSASMSANTSYFLKSCIPKILISKTISLSSIFIITRQATEVVCYFLFYRREDILSILHIHLVIEWLKMTTSIICPLVSSSRSRW